MSAHISNRDDLVGLPRLPLTSRQRYDLELLTNGGFSPLTGFMTEEEYTSVVESMHLPTGELWPIPIILDVYSGEYRPGEEILLTNEEGNPLAILHISSVYSPNKKNEAKKVYGTKDRTHPGVAYLFEKTGPMYLGGKVTPLAEIQHYDFLHLRYSPKALKEKLKAHAPKPIVAFQTRNPIHRAHFELLQRAAVKVGGHVLIHPVVGETKPGDIDYVTRVRSYMKLHEKYTSAFSTLSLLPLAMRMAGPREALWHALIRKNYGATHFIVGRDHAGPGNDREGNPFYGPYDAQNLALKHESDLGVGIIPLQEMVYSEDRKAYVEQGEVRSGEITKAISGTRFREMLKKGEPIPKWFSFPEVVEELLREASQPRGLVLFFTGLSGSGKTTIAKFLKSQIEELTRRPVTILDGDVVRQYLSKGLGFSREDRNTNIERIGFVSGEIARHGGIVICSAIAPYEESRRKNRDRISLLGTYVEIYVKTPVEVCKKRDVKGLYKKAEQGLMKGFTGVDDPYETPESPDIIVDGSKPEFLDSAIHNILTHLKERNAFPFLR